MMKRSNRRPAEDLRSVLAEERAQAERRREKARASKKHGQQGSANGGGSSDPGTGGGGAPVQFTLDSGGASNISGALDGVNATFTLAGPAGILALFVNGVRLFPGGASDYTLAGAVITLATAPDATSNIIGEYWS